MNQVEISCEGLDEPTWIDSLRSYIDAVLAHLGRDEWEVSVLIASKDLIANYNKEYRQKDGSTDVLSFCQVESESEVPSSGPFVAGDLVISPQDVLENAEYFGEDFLKELQRVTIHGLLHLSGLDHESNEADEPMLVRQEEILRALTAKGVLI